MSTFNLLHEIISVEMHVLVHYTVKFNTTKINNIVKVIIILIATTVILLLNESGIQNINKHHDTGLLHLELTANCTRRTRRILCSNFKY
uniref:Uncharacterized protein n=1 Tax=Pararge aegeria TaxID=116150 RepID=S4PZX4_9NEOP